jgi:hypothetical protein
MVCNDPIYRPTKANQKSKKFVQDGLRRLAATIGDYAVELFSLQ